MKQNFFYTLLSREDCPESSNIFYPQDTFFEEQDNTNNYHHDHGEKPVAPGQDQEKNQEHKEEKKDKKLLTETEMIYQQSSPYSSQGDSKEQEPICPKESSCFTPKNADQKILCGGSSISKDSFTLPIPKVVLFDWDGTLVDTARTSFHAINKVLTAFGKDPLTFSHFQAMPHLSIRMLFKTLFSSQQYHEAENLFNSYASRSTTSSIAGSSAVLSWLYDRRIPMGVVSNKEGTQLRREIEELKWSHYFYTAIGSYDTPEDKPSPTPLYHALDKINVKPDFSVWFVGDSLVDMMCAHSAGCLPICVGEQGENFTGFKISAQSCKGLLDFLQEIFRKS